MPWFQICDGQRSHQTSARLLTSYVAIARPGACEEVPLRRCGDDSEKGVQYEYNQYNQYNQYLDIPEYTYLFLDKTVYMYISHKVNDLYFVSTSTYIIYT